MSRPPPSSPNCSRRGPSQWHLLRAADRRADRLRRNPRGRLAAGVGGRTPWLLSSYIVVIAVITILATAVLPETALREKGVAWRVEEA